MSKLILSKIKKSYKLGDQTVQAINDVSISFRENEFVSILGPSGCGKTSLLNVIGGLDKYDSGDLIIGGLSTKEFKSADWDAYRNRSIGFVFQSYNLISHQTVLNNVEISLTLAGVSSEERKKRATNALRAVGLADQLNKKPAQMSGGQMQRVAIARALVNDPDIILADEPTGALDSQTSVQVMEILKEISKTKLVIMVTHNAELAEKYSSRIIRILDGCVQSDTNELASTYETNDQTPTLKLKKTSMSLITATKLSLKNLLTKKGRTIITSFAGSIGIIGVALVLALSSGLTKYMDNIQSDALAGFPITIGKNVLEIESGPRDENGDPIDMNKSDEGKFPSENIIYSYDKEKNTQKHVNILNDEYFQFIEKLPEKLPDSVNTISYERGVSMNILAKGENAVALFSTGGAGDANEQMRQMFSGSTMHWQEMPDNSEFVNSLYDFIGVNSRMPKNKNEVLLIVDEYNRIDKKFFDKLGLTQNSDYKLTDFIGKEILAVVPNNNFYTASGDLYSAATPVNYDALYNSDESIKLTVTGVMRLKKDAGSSYFSPGFVYTSELTNYIVNDAKNSDVAIAQTASNKNIFTGLEFLNDDAKASQLLSLGADTTPTGINIYPKDFASKDKIKDYLDTYNKGKNEKDKIIYSDLAQSISDITGKLLTTVSLVLIGFAAVSLVVSTIMISIITYVSVIERTKEIGILRAVGARKKDISRVFNAETLIIGFTAGAFGVFATYLLSIPINSVIKSLADIDNIAQLNPLHAVVLVCGSMLLTLIAGFIPSKMAAKKDPVEALRTE